MTDKRDYERAELLYRKVVALPRTFGGAFTNLIRRRSATGGSTALDSTAAAFRARFPDSNDLWEADWYAAWGQGRPDRADSISRAVFAQARTARQSIRSAGATAAVAYLHGRLAEGLRWGTLRTRPMMRANPSAANRLAFALDTAFYALQAGDAGRRPGRRPARARPAPHRLHASRRTSLGEPVVARRRARRCAAGPPRARGL